MTARATVRVDDLVVVRGDTRAVDGVGFTARAGEVLGLLGPSGSGKTSLLRAVVGVQIVTSGHVEVLGQPAGSADLRDRVAYVTQAVSVYDDLTVAENLRFFAAVLGADGHAVERAIAAVDLQPQKDRRVGRLSGGERSRTSLAVALLRRPEVLVLDEPTVGLDPVLRRDLWALFHRIAAAGATVLVSSHVMDEAARCDRLLLMRRGRLLADGSPAQLCERTGATDIEGAFLHLVESTPR